MESIRANRKLKFFPQQLQRPGSGQRFRKLSFPRRTDFLGRPALDIKRITA
jgi:hypothetical protein